MATFPDPYAETLQYPRSYILSTITAVAMAYAVDPSLCLATSYQESGFDPFDEGDNGTSFGLFQLHEGGELPAGKDKFWAFNPYNNANVAIKEIASVAHAHPGWSPGQIAAAAQRPADPSTYADDVNGIYRNIQTLGVDRACPSAAVFHPHNQQATGGDPGQVNPQGITGGVASGVLGNVLKSIGLPDLGSVLKLALAAGLGLVGLLFLFHKNISVSTIGKAAAFA